MTVFHRLSSRPWALMVALLAALFLGCAAPEGAPLEPIVRPQARPYRPPVPREVVVVVHSAAAEAPATVELGLSVRGRPIEGIVFEGTGGCVLILGGIHGDESVGSALIERLAEHLRTHAADCAGKRVVLIPRANPDGLAAGTRWNARDVDVNRNFPAANFTPNSRHGRTALCEPESRALVVAIARYRPSCIVSVHGPLRGIDPDGRAASWALAAEMAALSPLPLKDLAALPGSLGSYAGNTLGLKMITYELDRKDPPARNPSSYLESHLAALLLAISNG